MSGIEGCGRVLGHGETCCPGHLCSACEREAGPSEPIGELAYRADGRVRPAAFQELIERQAREIEQLKAARQAYANEFDGDTGSIHENIRKLKRECEEFKAGLKSREELVTAMAAVMDLKDTYIQGLESTYAEAKKTQEEQREMLNETKQFLTEARKMLRIPQFEPIKPRPGDTGGIGGSQDNP